MLFDVAVSREESKAPKFQVALPEARPEVYNHSITSNSITKAPVMFVEIELATQQQSQHSTTAYVQYTRGSLRLPTAPAFGHVRCSAQLLLGCVGFGKKGRDMQIMHIQLLGTKNKTQKRQRLEV